MNEKIIGIILKPKEIHEISSLLDLIISKVENKNILIAFHKNDRDRVLNYISETGKIIFIDSFIDTHMIISLGGDGTLLGTSRNIEHCNTPIVGVNMGSLGFITEFTRTDFEEYLDSLIEDNFETYEQFLFEAKVFRKGQSVGVFHFANDVVFGVNGIARMCKLSVKAGDEDIYTISGDGLIVSTPIGSTAYSMSAGGPITHKDVHALIISPICPHSLTKRPMVIPDDFHLEVIHEDGEEQVSLTIDGQEFFNLEKEDNIFISKSEQHKVRFVKNPNRAFFSTLKEKFGD